MLTSPGPHATLRLTSLGPHVIVARQAEETITGTWEFNSSAAREKEAAGAGAPTPPFRGDNSVERRRRQSHLGVWHMGDMLAGKYQSFNHSRQRAGQLSKRVMSLKGRLTGKRPRRGSCWASVHGWTAGGSMIQDVNSLEEAIGREKQASHPSHVAEQLIARQQVEPVLPPVDRKIDAATISSSPRKSLSRSYSRRPRVFRASREDTIPAQTGNGGGVASTRSSSPQAANDK